MSASAPIAPVLILGSFTTALGSLRSFGAAGVPTYCLTTQMPFVRASRWFQGPPAGAPVLHETDALADYLEALDCERAVLFPCSDEWVEAVNQLPGELRDRYLTSLPPKTVLDTLLDKAKLEELGAEQNVPRPHTVVLRSRDDLADLEEAQFVSRFLKPCHSRPFARQFGVKAFAVKDRTDALTRYDDISRHGHDLVLQEYIQGPPNEHYLIDGVVDAGGRLRTLFARRRIRMYPLDFGDSSHIRSVPREEMGAAADALQRLLETMRYRGIFSAEFKRDGRDGEHKLLEINTRAWTYVEFPLLCGINMPYMAYRDALGLPVEDEFDYAVGKRLTVLPLDIKAAIALRAQGNLKTARFLRTWLSAHSLYFRLGDMKPGIVHVKEILKHRLFRRRDG